MPYVLNPFTGKFDAIRTASGGGDMFVSVYDPAGGARQVAFSDQLPLYVPTTRTLNPGTGLSGGGDLSADRSFALADTTVTPGTYTLASITVDQQGRITSASDGVDTVQDGTTVGQMLYWNGTLWEVTVGLIWDEASDSLNIVGTSGPQQRWSYDASNYATLEVSASGALFIWPTGNEMFIGNLAGVNNTGISSNGLGYATLRNNTGHYSNGLGHGALYNNAGQYCNGLGHGVLYYNTGISSNGLGHAVLRYNTGIYSNGLGHATLQYNIGDYSNGLGYNTLEHNTGIYSNGLGHVTLRYNTGNHSNGLGYSVLRYNQSEYAGAFGHNAWSEFLDDTDRNQTFDNTNIDSGTDRITVTSHGFGASGRYINLRYTEGTSPIGGLVDQEIYQVKIIDANTIGFYEADGPNGANRGTDITDVGTGTGHILTPQYEYPNTVCIGNNSSPNRSRSIYLGGDDHDIVELDVETTVVNFLFGKQGFVEIADDASYDLPSGVAGWGKIVIGDGGGGAFEWANFNFQVDGTVFLESNSTNVANTDTDGSLCISDNGTNVRIRNRLGSALTMRYEVKYS